MDSEQLAGRMAEQASRLGRTAGDVNIHIAGISIENPGPGGYSAAIQLEGERPILLGGNHAETTSRRMKLMAIARALETVNHDPQAKGLRVRVHSRSKYIAETFNSGWIGKWQRNGWTTTRREPVKNQDLWGRILELIQDREMNWVWAHGDSPNPLGDLSFGNAVQQVEKLTGPLPKEDSWE